MQNMYDKKAAIQVLGVLYSDPDSIFAQPEKFNLTQDDFELRLHRILFSAAYNMYHAGAQSLSVINLSEYLQKYPEIYKAFIDLNGDEILLTAIEMAEKDNFSFYYDKLKKMSLLRSLKEENFDISDWHAPESYDIAHRQNLALKLEKASIEEIVQSFQSKIVNIESKFLERETFSIMSIGDILDDVLEDLDKSPDFGMPLEGKIISHITRGARKKKLYLISASTGVGKSRFMISQACRLAFPIRWSPDKNNWEVTGSSEKTGFVTTELEHKEIGNTVLAYVSGIEEDVIKAGNFSDKVRNRLRTALGIIKKYGDNLISYHMPDPNISQINNGVRKMVLKYGLDNLFFDYIHTSPQLLAEFSGMKIREDVALSLVSTALKNLANELNIFVMSGTQLNREGDQAEFANENSIQGSRAVANKIDFGAVIRLANPEWLGKVSHIISKNKPNQFMDVYKNRGSKHKRVRVWLDNDLGIARINTLFLTSEFFDPVPIDIVQKSVDTSSFDLKKILKEAGEKFEEMEKPKEVKITL